jgi:GT2 family glycosyltransferase
VVAFLDDDAVAATDWIAGLVRGYAEEGSALGVGGSIEPIWTTGRPRWFPSEFGWVVGCSYTGLPERSAAVRNMIGTNMSFRREVFETLGGFDSRIGRIGKVPIGCDETELCIRARRRWPDREIMYDPRAHVVHNVPASRTSWRYFVTRCHAEGRSKAIVVRLAGSTRALSTEIGYSTRVLPAGVVAGLRDAIADGDGSGLARAAAIVIGFAATSLGFVAGWIEGARRATR